jgi:hypothetical protein
MGRSFGGVLLQVAQQRTSAGCCRRAARSREPGERSPDGRQRLHALVEVGELRYGAPANLGAARCLVIAQSKQLGDVSETKPKFFARRMKRTRARSSAP